MDGFDPALLDPLVFDGRVERVARALDRARRRVQSVVDGRGRSAGDDAGPAALDDVPSPWTGARAVSSRATLDATLPLARDRLFAALREWTMHLTIARVTYDDELAVARARAERSVEPDLGDVTRSLASLRHELLVEPRESPRRERLARALTRRAAAMQPLVRHWFERRAEASRQLRGSSPPAELPLGNPPGTRASAPQVSPEALAGKLLAIVASSGVLPAQERGRSRSLEALLDATLARDATEGWPAQLNVRWIASLFGDTELVQGLALDLEADDLPAAIGGASFARALGAFGRAVFDADRPRATPFALARSPLDERAFARKWLFAGLPGTASFGRAFLSLGHDRARIQARAILRSAGVHAAFVAIAAVVQLNGTMPERRARAAFEETTACAFGDPLSGQLIGAIPRARFDASADLVGLLLAARDAERLRDVFDEDWFRNPRAHEALRHEHAALAAPPDAATLDEGLAAVERAMADAVG